MLMLSTFYYQIKVINDLKTTTDKADELNQGLQRDRSNTEKIIKLDEKSAAT